MLNLKEIATKDEWEGFIKVLQSRTGFQPLFFQGWEWGELERARGKIVYCLGVYEQEGPAITGGLIGIALAVLVKARRGNFLHIRGGPLMDWESQEQKQTQEIAKLFIKFASDLKCDFLRISPNIFKSVPKNVNWLLQTGFKYCQMHDVDAEVTWILDLTQSEEEILKGMRDTTRYLIRKAQKLSNEQMLQNEQKIPGLEIVKISDAKENSNAEDNFDSGLKIFWWTYQDTVKRQKWHAYSYEYIKAEFLEYAKNGKASLFLVKYQGKYIAASIFLYEFGQCFYHHSGSLSEFKKIPAMYLLHWESILEAKRRGCNKYNFFGIAGDDDPKHPWAGLSLFKKGFGGYKQEMVHAMDYPLTKKYWVTHLYEKVERKVRGYK